MDETLEALVGGVKSGPLQLGHITSLDLFLWRERIDEALTVLNVGEERSYLLRIGQLEVELRRSRLDRGTEEWPGAWGLGRFCLARLLNHLGPLRGNWEGVDDVSYDLRGAVGATLKATDGSLDIGVV